MNPETFPNAFEPKLKEPKKTWLDVTDIAEFIKNYSSVTGIQRMVSMLVLAVDSLNEATTDEPNQKQNRDSVSRVRVPARENGEFVLCRYDFKIQAYVAIPRATFQQALKEFMAGTLRNPRQRTFEAPSNLKVYLQLKLSRFTSFVAKRSFRPLIPNVVISLASRAFDRLLERCNDPISDELTPCSFQPGDAFVFLGAFWFQPFYINVIISNCHAYRLRLFLAVNDLIPIRFPTWFPPNYADTWEKSVELGLRSADCAISISRYGEQDLLTFCREREIPPPQTAVLRLGDEITEDPHVTMPAIKQRVTPYLRPGFVLVVSSIDVRKNQEVLIDVWERLYRKHGPATPYLILIGKPGRDYLRIKKTMARTKFVNGRIVVLHDVGDRELLAFYQQAMFTMLPSLAEGWGLPVAESMAQGKLCIASNATSIPEIAGPLAEYFDPRDVEHCYQLVERYAFNAELRSAAETRIKEQYHPMSWASTARSLLAILESASVSRPSSDGRPSN